MAIPIHYRMLVNDASDMDQRYVKTRNSEDGCVVLFHQISSLLPLKSPQNPILGDLSMENIIQRALRKSHVNGATKLKFYSYIGIGKYLGCVKIFPLGGVQGAQGFLM